MSDVTLESLHQRLSALERENAEDAASDDDLEKRIAALDAQMRGNLLRRLCALEAEVTGNGNGGFAGHEQRIAALEKQLSPCVAANDPAKPTPPATSAASAEPWTIEQINSAIDEHERNGAEREGGEGATWGDFKDREKREAAFIAGAKWAAGFFAPKNPPATDDAPQFGGCIAYTDSSRICQRGQKGCVVDHRDETIARLRAELERGQMLIGGAVASGALDKETAGSLCDRVTQTIDGLRAELEQARRERDEARTDAEGRKRFEQWYKETMEERDQKTEECGFYLQDRNRIAGELMLAIARAEKAERERDEAKQESVEAIRQKDICRLESIKLRDMLEASKNGHWYGRMVTAEAQRDEARAEAEKLAGLLEQARRDAESAETDAKNWHREAMGNASERDAAIARAEKAECGRDIMREMFNQADAKLRECRDLTGEPNMSPVDAVRRVVSQRDHHRAMAEKLQAFKDFVHKRLDEMAIPTHPDGPHSRAGCRIGDRLDIVQDAIAERKSNNENKG